MDHLVEEDILYFLVLKIIIRCSALSAAFKIHLAKTLALAGVTGPTADQFTPIMARLP